MDDDAVTTVADGDENAAAGAVAGSEDTSALAQDQLAATAADQAGFLGAATDLLDKGGIAIWAIAALSVLTLSIILWKLWRFTVIGVWRRDRAETAVTLWQQAREHEAIQEAAAGRGVRARFCITAMQCVVDPIPSGAAREETTRVAKRLLAEARTGLRALELIATIAPLLGLLGTVLGMIAAFQTLQAAGSRADPSALAGGIWEALLTTAAGMAVAIPASAALTWFESVTDRLRLDFEDIATRVFSRSEAVSLAHAAE